MAERARVRVVVTVTDMTTGETPSASRKVDLESDWPVPVREYASMMADAIVGLVRMVAEKNGLKVKE